MRATLLLVLGAVLVWFVWHSLDSRTANAGDERGGGTPGVLLPPEADEPSAELAGTANQPAGTSAQPAGTFVPADSTPKAGAVGQPAAREGGARHGEPSSDSTTTRSDAPAATSTPVVADTKGAEGVAGVGAGSTRAAAIPVPGAVDKGTASSSELELARRLVSDPTTFLQRLGESSTPTGARRLFATGIGKALGGAESEARSILESLASESEVKSGERECIVRLLDRGSVHVSSASFVAESPLVRAAYLVAQSRNAEKLAAESKHRDAAAEYSEILLGYVAAPWSSDPEVLRRWTRALEESQRRHRWSRSGEWPSITVEVKEGDSLIAIRKRVVDERKDVLLCTGQIVQANELHGTTLKPGQKLRIPLDRARMLVDLDSHWAFYLLGDEVVAAWEVGVGKVGNETQVGTFVVGEKKEEPMWFRPGQAPVPYGDPANPLGTRWIAWMTPDGVATGLGFHGTSEPESIGKDLSQGCIRMRNADVERLFEVLPKGAEIRVQP